MGLKGFSASRKNKELETPNTIVNFILSIGSLFFAAVSRN
jgi:hypothetical protein